MCRERRFPFPLAGLDQVFLQHRCVGPQQLHRDLIVGGSRLGEGLIDSRSCIESNGVGMPFLIGRESLFLCEDILIRFVGHHHKRPIARGVLHKVRRHLGAQSRPSGHGVVSMFHGQAALRLAVASLYRYLSVEVFGEQWGCKCRS
ncbi:MAG: hypothetical protein H8E53_01610 [Planctomycetes bacterium]|nr:hypothetical protein [Planctomycetota bacterium]